ncbi:MAG: hypothetical protein KGZ57_05510 [Dethiobacter sp.]|nr:hypothetical protein [Dethiobacter sp.]
MFGIRVGDKLSVWGEQVKHPETLATVKGISLAKDKTISESVVNTITCQKVISFLSRLGVTPNLAVKAFKKWGGATIDKISANPYCLTNLRMVGFAQADGNAKALGISPASEFRVKAGILHTLRESAATATCRRKSCKKRFSPCLTARKSFPDT